MNKYRIIFILVALFFLSACYHNISQVMNKWGPPAKIEQTNGKVVYYYYFYRRGGAAYATNRFASWGETGGWLVVEITTDLNGKILKKREYWKQPEIK